VRTIEEHRNPDGRLVVSLATIPSRIDHLRPVIDSLGAQTRRPDRVYVCICEYNRYEGRGYEVPSWLRDDPLVQIVVAPEDHGPANKLLGVLPLERAATTRIVVVDDDWCCNPDLLASLDLRFGHGARTAIGLSGARLPRRWSRMEVRIGPSIERSPPLPWRLTFLAEPPASLSVDLLQFGFGSMLRRDWFADDIFDLVDPGLPWFYADDVLLSGYLASKGIERLCVAGMRLPQPLEQASLSPLSGDGRMTERYRRAIPALAAELGIWRRADLAPAFPRRPTLRELGYWSGLAVREVRRLAARAAGAKKRSTSDSQ
jgi:hypothetical protein